MVFQELSVVGVNNCLARRAECQQGPEPEGGWTHKKVPGPPIITTTSSVPRTCGEFDLRPLWAAADVITTS